jgi:hypothetical protein
VPRLDETARVLVVTQADLDQFFDDVTAQNKGLSQPHLARMNQIMQSYELKLLGRHCSQAGCRCAVLLRIRHHSAPGSAPV